MWIRAANVLLPPQLNLDNEVDPVHSDKIIFSL